MTLEKRLSSKSPDDLSITIRNLRFRFDGDAAARDGNARDRRWWHGGDPVATAFFNALSATFPDGEKFFMDSVREYRHLTSEPLRSQIKDFVGQEAVHSREHREFNALATNAGYDIARLEARTQRVIALGKRNAKIRQLAATCALEHFTAILAHALLEAESTDLAGAPDEAKRMWSWHAMEELEHKAVAFDTMMVATRNWSSLRRYFLRTVTMVASTLLFFWTIGANMASLYREDRINTPATWWKTAKYLLGKPGVLRRCFFPYLQYYRPGFHPWDHDDRDLLTATEAKYGLAAA
ncbi:metal-dependent hydrolase [Sphingopyxis sp. 550A]|jgi:predicted metal-dependent hydrolase